MATCLLRSPLAQRSSSLFTYSSVSRSFRQVATSSLRTTPQLQKQIAVSPRHFQTSSRQLLRSLSQLESMSEAQNPQVAGQEAEAANDTNSFILTLSCPDRKGIVHAVTGFLAQRGLNIRDSAQFGDPITKRFFMRVHAESDIPFTFSQSALKAEFEQQTGIHSLDFEFHNANEKPRTLIMVSKIGHCLNDLLFRVSSGSLPIDVPVIVSNHADYEALAAAHKIPFVHLPIDTKAGKTKEWQESEILKLCTQYKIDLVVLARYMQILSPKLCEVMSGRIINIHHSFLPSFKGARPYHQAYERGIKLIGATAHYVTADLDEGPIIEQDVERVNHALPPLELTKAGADIEARVLARAVRWHSERRVILNGAKTVVFN
ncbi:Formyltetrahydrofolate deformylase [Meira miltonrushii]|uniref:Formyltetrahydrofolate deformylase n=1 Tax=Meira miltonrushii TaxID=1280837 RepID=A0A316VG31_9BASI|nr:Formyltetrahydrofolate deformylase [Meira miltonrushii]PWN34961.1 Formyltetrahydrofolate deformylase [Meira miltonrushii]